MTVPADQLLQAIQADPHRAAADAREALAKARAVRDHAAAAAAQRVLGLAAHGLHDVTAAAAHLRAAIRSAHRAGDATVEAECRMSHALVLDDRGASAAALREIERACLQLTGLRLARATMQRALILRRVGRDDDALAGYQRALTAFRQHGDALWEGRALVNRGVLRGYRGELGPARADLGRAVQIFTDLGLPDAVARTQHNLGFLAAQAGDVPAALSHYDQARDRLAYVGAAAVTQLDRAELLLTARLRPEARAAVGEAVEAARAGAFSSLLGQAQLLSARIELVGGDAGLARTLARQARATFTRQSRPIWAALAHRVELGARVAAAGGNRRVLRDLETVGDRLAAAVWLPSAWDTWVDAAHVAVDLDDMATATRCLEKADAGRHAGSAPLRARAWHAAARIALREDRLPVAKRRLAAGYRDIEQHQATLGATELGMRGGAVGVDIAAARLRLSLGEGDARGALTWLQRVRSAALRLPPARPSDDPVVEALLAELRTVATESATTAIDSPRTARLLRRQRAIEAEVRQRSWLSAGTPVAARRPPTLAALSAALGDRVLVELAALDGQLHALVLADGRVRHRRLCPVEPVATELTALRFAIRRRVVYPGTRIAARADDAAAYSAGVLDRLLLRPLADLLDERPVVLVPSGALHAMPWAMLPTCHGRAVTVSPSSWQWWWAATADPHGGHGRVLVAGPAPHHASVEVTALAGWLPAVTALTGAAATVTGALRTLDGAALGHVASHGVFRADNPMFSHLILADGPLTVCDLSALRHPPELLVLSSCDAGLSAVHPGDELQGLAAALLGLGTRTVVASLGPVDDEDTLRLMTDLHRRLADGVAPAVALARAQSAGVDRISAATFICLGAG
ncbi:CHAT domain-containing protein [Dactylosporangium siamense]|uniref:CHAT domain-containing protein n=1 Tax=Dactylosporangium siamense TaxID=685454 RepID=A0A919U7C4_9ACTN|nr:CHAT domain-containing protein [Dactylosporangium siamense]GIG45384.1 CHAT domain-containing protein [Dactylosporangium siamense]